MSSFISSETLVSYKQCKRKAFFLLNNKQDGIINEYASLLDEQTRKCETEYIDKFILTKPDAVVYSLKALEKGNSTLFSVKLNWEDLTTNPSFLIWKESIEHKRKGYYEPVVVIGNYTITKEQILEVAFAGYVLSKLQGKKIESGTIITADNKSHRIKFETASKTIEPILAELRKWKQSPDQQPSIILNKYCSYCPFKEECYAKAKEIDHLSLLQGISKKEIDHQNKKGIFTVTQYSYTYRPRKKRKSAKGELILKHYYSLKALAIRNNQSYVIDKPIVNLSETLIFLDVEGIPDQNFYYLIGLVIVTGSSTQSLSFWANNQDQEEDIWEQLLKVIKSYESFTMFHYGSYETEFIEKMESKYSTDNKQLITKIKSSCVNVLSLIYSNIYFPTYSNGLKDIGSYIGVMWSAQNASGLQSLVWRHKWEVTHNEIFKQTLIAYNIEDCLAVKAIIQVISSIINQDKNPNKCLDIIFAENIKIDPNWRRFGRNEFALKDVAVITKCAYFDYQRERVFFRKTKNKNKVNKQKRQKHRQPVKTCYINKKIEISAPLKCYKCDSSGFYYGKRLHKTVYDLKFFNFGIKRWVIRYFTSSVRCKACNYNFLPDKYRNIQTKYGEQLKIWVVYQAVALRQPIRTILRALDNIFDYQLTLKPINDFKVEIATFYSETYNQILLNLQNGHLVHADETKANIQGVNAYVWVFTSFEEVIYVYSPTREGDMVKDLLKGFKGVLVSDFYFAYDSIECPQQKCLVHLIRDMNDDLLRNPFDEQFKLFLEDFTTLLKSIIDTVDRYGLKKYHLSKHKRDVKKFFDKYLSFKYESEVLAAYQKRLNHNQTKLFTFLDYDGVPWNNNNAEHAIKGFAAFRDQAGAGFTANGLSKFLILLSIYKTCEYKNINFLKFLRSREKDIDKFCNS